ncbi:MAG TPA: hypothetical protein VJU61_01100, partial [Polyangiaceae bacterium]|nr:hypothetical protein [Polyangiaceae bacterium]
MYDRFFSSLAAAASLALLALACENDVLHLEGDKGTAVSPYFSRDDAGVELPGPDSSNDAGSTSNVPCIEDAECDDGDSCTGTEACVAGFCRAGEHPTCFDGDPCTTDTCIQATGTCSFTTVRDGLPCDDGNLCDGQTCSNGTCVAGPAPVCAADSNRCTTHSCDPASGACVMQVLADGVSCSDGDACNGAEVCSNGACQAGPGLSCNDRNPCTSDACDPAVGCVNLGLQDGTA